ncbi:hypothetical protein [Candidatus Venteria ishoeyi]|uniref:Uncharacterized protein n=1 Tax=Candidatus Venteria ishoeyi TaxID=1899563 RepID=A0A1H6FE30_9GAMM|nr:hypothetical protein [Candidatus Venteria ishoeyi]MDM8545386.1 hypothetical protein [Candidatus Venteria ishoeyi]SEH07274.1 Uncharacterised protein [Candidatus Venteria ishoeyi]
MNFFKNPLVTWITAFAVTLLVFYLINHGIMSMQGLPLNIDLTPAQ